MLDSYFLLLKTYFSNYPFLYGAIVTAFFTLITSYIIAAYTSNRNRQQEKYFKLQDKAEEVIWLIWRWEDLHQQSIDEKDNNKFLWEIWKNSWELVWYDWEKYQKSSDKLEVISNDKQFTYEKIFSKIKIYFVDWDLREIREFSEQLSRTINVEHNDVKISSELGRLSKMIDVKVRRLWRSWIENKIRYWVDRYDRY